MIAGRNDGQRCFGIRAVEDLLFGKRVDRAEILVACGDVTHFGFFNAPIHSRRSSPGFERLLRGELVAEAVPRFLAYVGHC
ncbi:hypothetical protein X961_5846 [Burkholderia pseudomallei MSHR5613]|nr:hypothetical protein X961_5846 [Burkholderia pseudomallei MSHR5613]